MLDVRSIRHDLLVRPVVFVGAALLAAVSGVTGCATERSSYENDALVGTEPKQLWSEDDTEAQAADGTAAETRPASAPLSVEEARRIALAHDAAHSCEITARRVRGKDAVQGWAIMEQCVRRPDFTDLESLIGPIWAADLAKAPAAGELVAHVMALRGGDVENDLRVVRRRKLPLFSLRAALADPGQYRGRLVVLRGKAKEGRRADRAGGPLLVQETKVMAEAERVRVGPQTSSTSDSDVRDHSTGSPRRTSSERFSRTDGGSAEVLHNVSVETGRALALRVGADDPFLEPGTDYVMVVRFDGPSSADADDGQEEDDAPSATVVAYFEPETSLFARLGR
jgi:hypothetical protein